jgi:hypothetical protein
MTELHPHPKPPVTRKRAPKKPKNRGRSAFPHQRDKDYTRWVRTENHCLLRGRVLAATISPRDGKLPDTLGIQWVHFCFGPRDPAHVNRTRAQGVPDFGEVICLCRAAHRWLDNHTRAEFERATGFSQQNLTSAAAGLALRYVERGGQPVTPATSKLTRARPEETEL